MRIQDLSLLASHIIITWIVPEQSSFPLTRLLGNCFSAIQHSIVARFAPNSPSTPSRALHEPGGPRAWKWVKVNGPGLVVHLPWNWYIFSTIATCLETWVTSSSIVQVLANFHLCLRRVRPCTPRSTASRSATRLPVHVRYTVIKLAVIYHSVQVSDRTIYAIN